MSKDTIDRIIDGVRTLGLVGLGIYALHLGFGDAGGIIIGGGLGLAAPAARRKAVSP